MFFANGNKSFEVPHVKGIKQGTQILYSEKTGAIIMKTTIANNIEHGLKQYFDENSGELYREETYEFGQLIVKN